MNVIKGISIAILSLLIIACGGDQKSTSSSTPKSTPKSESKEASASSTAAASTSNRKGKLVYKQYCVICHGADGKLAVSGATDLSQSTISLEERITQITNGKGLMTPYKGILSEEQIASVAEYIGDLRE